MKNNEKLVILEIGCGISLHSLRMEVELLLNDSSDVHCIRINPHNFGVRNGNIGIGLGSMEALNEISKRL